MATLFGGSAWRGEGLGGAGCTQKHSNQMYRTRLCNHRAAAPPMPGDRHRQLAVSSDCCEPFRIITKLAQKRRRKAFHLATIVETKTSLAKRAVVHNHKGQSGSPRSRLSCAAASRRISSTLRTQSKRLRTRSRSRHDLTRLDSELKLAKEDVVKRKGQRTESFRRFDLPA